MFGLSGRDATQPQTYRDGCAERVVLITDVTAVGSVCVVVARGDGVWGRREGGSPGIIKLSVNLVTLILLATAGPLGSS